MHINIGVVVIDSNIDKMVRREGLEPPTNRL